VKWFDKAKGYGFLGRAAGPDVFVHFRSIQGEGYKNLIPGEPVSFEIVQSEKGAEAHEVVTLTARPSKRPEMHKSETPRAPKAKTPDPEGPA
jgi:CspA family cold shock protein